MKDVQEECEWKWLVNKQNKILFAKENGDSYK